MSKEDYIAKICEIDKQLSENKKCLEPYIGVMIKEDSKIWHLDQVTKMLLELRIRLGNELREKYDVFII